MTVTFDYSNAPTRPTGPVLRVLGGIKSGIRRVRAQAEPYAQDWEAANRRALAGEGPVWFCVGDSMAQGVGASAYDRGFVGLLSDRLAGEWPHRLVNLSAFGARVQDAIDDQLAAMDDLAAQGIMPELVTVLIGSNDVFSRGQRTGLVQRYTDLLDRLPQGAVVGNLPNPHREVVEIDRILRERDARGDLHLADLRRQGPRSWRGLVAADWFHPNDAGYAGMADVIERPVRTALGLG